MQAIFEEGMAYLARWFSPFFYDTGKVPSGVMLRLSLGLEAWVIDSWASYPIYRVGLFKRNLDCFLKVSYCLKPCSILQAVMSPSFSVEEGDGIGSDAYCTPNARKSVCQGVSVLMIGL